MAYKISLSAINIPSETYKVVEQALLEGNIGQSHYIEEFEQRIADYVGAKYCIATSSGTMADAVAVAAARWMYKFDFIVVPALTFIAQPNAAKMAGAKVVFVDVKEDWTINISEETIDGLKCAIFATDIMGRFAQVDDPWIMIEDACESFGSRWNGKFSGRFGTLGTYSFFPSHTVSTGEGGAIVTDDERLALQCRLLRNHGRDPSNDPMDKFHFPYAGFNAKMSSIQAVIGISVMNHIQEYVDKRKQVFDWMHRGFGTFTQREGEEIVPHGYPIEFKSETDRNHAMKGILEAGIECRKFFSCLPMDEPPWQIDIKMDSMFPVASHIAHTHAYVPCHQNLSRGDVEYIIQVVKAQKGIA